jgi:nucleoside-diphosphate-sugar epimerase
MMEAPQGLPRIGGKEEQGTVHIFVTGASGYIGGSVAAALLTAGHRVVGLVRQQDKAAELARRGIEPLLGALTDFAKIAEAARAADGVVHTANADDFLAADTLVKALAGSGKPLVHTSGSSIISDRAAGEYSAAVFNEDSPFDPLPERLLRVAVDKAVLRGGQQGVRSVVIRPTLIYGRGRGLNPDSVQIPRLIGLAKAHGVARHVGRGLNVWSHVHIDDLVELYLLALAGAPAGSLFYAESGEAAWKDMASAVGRLLGLGPQTLAWPVEDAIREWGPTAIVSYGSNSRVSALKARKMLGWTAKAPPLLDDIETGSYATQMRNGA